jgi:TPR repeat protein
MTKGGAAKGELVLAIFELANCFRYAWGVKKDPIAARQYYETAANLGDTDALEEAAWCYLEGFGGPKDKVSSGSALLVSARCFFCPTARVQVPPIIPSKAKRERLARSLTRFLSLLTHYKLGRHAPSAVPTCLFAATACLLVSISNQ